MLSVSTHLHASRVFVGAASVGDDVEIALVRPCHDEVIDYSSFVIGEEGQCTLVVLEFCNICNHERLHELHPVFAMDFGLTEKEGGEKKMYLNKALVVFFLGAVSLITDSMINPS